MELEGGLYGPPDVLRLFLVCSAISLVTYALVPVAVFLFVAPALISGYIGADYLVLRRRARRLSSGPARRYLAAADVGGEDGGE